MNPDVRKFVLRGISFAAIFPFGYALTHACIHYAGRLAVGPPRDTVYVWGDSRTYLGLDVERLGDLTDRPVRSWALQGAGPYDLLVFARDVPVGSDVIVGVSLPMLVRPAWQDYNRTGFSLRAISACAWHGYPLQTLGNIVRYNRDPLHSEMRTTTDLRPAAAEPRTDGLDLYRERFAAARPPQRYLEKLELYRRALRILKEKQCRVTVIDFPVYGLSAELQRASIYAEFPQPLFDLADGQLQILHHIELSGQDEANLMYDLSHLNARGRELMTDYVHEHVFASRR